MATNNVVNAPFPLSATQGGTGVASPTVNGVLVAQGASAANSLVLTDGQLLIGNTGSDPAQATLTAGTGVSIVNGSGTITISSDGDIPWVVQQSATVTLAINTGYTTDNGAVLVTYTLPTAAAVGDFAEITGGSAGGWIIAQAASQQINFGDQATTVGATGTLASTNTFDCIKLRALSAGATSTWLVVSAVGNLTVV